MCKNSVKRMDCCVVLHKNFTLDEGNNYRIVAKDIFYTCLRQFLQMFSAAILAFIKPFLMPIHYFHINYYYYYYLLI